MSIEEEEEMRKLKRQMNLLASVYRVILELAEANTKTLQLIAENQKETAMSLLTLTVAVRKIAKKHEKLVTDINQFLREKRGNIAMA